MTAREAERTPTNEGDEEDDDDEAHAEGTDQLEEEEPVIVTIQELTTPPDYRQLLRGNDSDTGRISEAESNRSEKSYVDVRPNTTYSKRSWPEENASD